MLDELFDGRRPAELFSTSVFGVLELKSALKRLARARKIAAVQYRELIADFATDSELMSLLTPVDNLLMDEAAAILDRHPLRAGDAVHFASILRVKQVAERRQEKVIVVSSDRDLLDACMQEGITVFDPQDKGAMAQLKDSRDGS
ncbi:MAG: type II toxin-antitoxin system VapC family toxin [Chloroflexi bacterium]|nr:type II toxin-antitoxin system VapC family toxin [Chloroflexota bacterium]